MYEQEEQEKMILLDKQEQEGRKQEELNRKRAELEMKPLPYIPLGHGDMKWQSPDEAMHRRFKLSLGINGEVCCNFVEQECPRDMRWRLACYDRFVLPLTTMELQAVGFVEGYSDPETDGFTEQRGKTETLRPVAMLNRKLRRLNAAITGREEHDLGLSAVFALEAEEDQGLLYHQKKQQNEDLRLNALSLSGTLSGGGEGEGEYRLLFESPGESDWVKVSEPYVPKFPTEEIRKREEWRKEQLKHHGADHTTGSGTKEGLELFH
ncbi:hypothetical protein E2562_022085, partial [Oryza meyeriana var. granulata]